MARKSSPPGLETTLASLEQLVEKMESGDLSLEDSLKAFEQGVKLTRECQQALQAAEQKVQILLDPEADPEDFTVDGNDDRDG